jgi:hypothetical protein
VALARLSKLRQPKSAAAVLVLSEVVAKLQTDLVDYQDIVMDRAVAADTALGRGAISAGRAAVLETLAALGPLALEDDVRGALHGRCPVMRAAHETAPSLFMHSTRRLLALRASARS